MALGIVQGVTPFGTSMDGLATAGGLGYRGSPRYQFAKSFGQAIGGLALTLLGTGGTLGGMGLNLSGIGAAVGVPAVALSFAIMTAGTANVLAQIQGQLTQIQGQLTQIQGQPTFFLPSPLPSPILITHV